MQAQIGASPSAIPFGNVTQGVPVMLNLTIDNLTNTPLVVQDINAYHGDAFHVTDTAFTVPAGGNHTVVVTCDPRHNVDYADWLMVKSSSHPEVPHVLVTASGHYAESYYDQTQNLWNEQLKTALSSIVSTGMVAHTYNESRDQMYMIIDNQKINGQGAAQNTLECIYTGFLAVGYTSRTDAQNNFNLNTEHTMPQSLFNSTLPELSDLNHIFVTTANANSERGNNPFGVVANPSWTQGGSKSNGNLFEPRDEQKGASVRALLYFLFRYQDYQGFICGQEATLRAWNSQYLPDAVDRKRNDDIFAYQHNRNPFVDHPEFLDRIAGLCTVNNGDPSPIAAYVNDSLNFGYVMSGDSLDGYYAISNQGTNDLNISNIAISNADFELTGPTSLTIAKDSIALIPLRFKPTVANVNLNALLTFTTDAPNTPTRSVFLYGNSFVIAVDPRHASQPLQIFPQPAHDAVSIALPETAHLKGQISIWNLAGQRLRTMDVAKGDRLIHVSLAGLAQGMYLVRVQLGQTEYLQKLIVE